MRLAAARAVERELAPGEAHRARDGEVGVGSTRIVLAIPARRSSGWTCSAAGSDGSHESSHATSSNAPAMPRSERSAPASVSRNGSGSAVSSAIGNVALRAKRDPSRSMAMNHSAHSPAPLSAARASCSGSTARSRCAGSVAER